VYSRDTCRGNSRKWGRASSQGVARQERPRVTSLLSARRTQNIEVALSALPGTAPDRPPPPRTKWTRRVPHLVLIGHAASLGTAPDRIAAVEHAMAACLALPPSRLGDAIEARPRPASPRHPSSRAAPRVGT
jgi:hypothetical protein